MNSSIRQLIITISLIGSGLIIIDSLHLGEAFALFLLAGTVPGTTIVLGSSELLMFYALVFGFIVSRLSMAAYRRAYAAIQSRKA